MASSDSSLPVCRGLEKAQGAVPSSHSPHERQRWRSDRRCARRMLENQEARRLEACRGGIEHAEQIDVGVGRIQERKRESREISAAQDRRDVASFDPSDVRLSAGGKILRNGRRGTGVPLDEGDMRRAATQRFDADRAAARVRVEDACTRHASGHDVEQRFPKPVGCRSGAHPWRHRQPPALQPPGDDPKRRHGGAVIQLR